MATREGQVSPWGPWHHSKSADFKEATDVSPCLAAAFSNLPTDFCDWASVVSTQKETEKKLGVQNPGLCNQLSHMASFKTQNASCIPAVASDQAMWEFAAGER